MKYIIYGQDKCQYCKKAQELLNELESEHEYEYREITENLTQFLNRNASKINGQRTIPIIFKQSWTDELEFIGGYNELVNDTNYF